MENEHLRTAITRAGLTLEEFADIVQVDVKTVRRWLAGRTPYPRHRARVAGALDTTEHALWPDAVPAPTTLQRGRADDPWPGDVVAGYGYATDPAAPNPVELLPQRSSGSSSSSPISHPAGIVELLRASAADGCHAQHHRGP